MNELRHDGRAFFSCERMYIIIYVCLPKSSSGEGERWGAISLIKSEPSSRTTMTQGIRLPQMEHILMVGLHYYTISQVSSKIIVEVVVEFNLP